MLCSDPQSTNGLTMLLKILICVHGIPLFLQFAIVQFSTNVQIESSFSDSDQNNLETNIDNIRQFRGWTHTASAIEFVV